MAAIRLYHHPECARCHRIARVHRKLHWFHRVEISTATPPPGPLRLGEIAVEDLATGETTKGAAAFAQVCRHIPAYAPGLLLLRLPLFRSRVERSLSGCDGDACQNPGRP
jgi:hypothetical protein